MSNSEFSEGEREMSQAEMDDFLRNEFEREFGADVGSDDEDEIPHVELHSGKHVYKSTTKREIWNPLATMSKFCMQIKTASIDFVF